MRSVMGFVDWEHVLFVSHPLKDMLGGRFIRFCFPGNVTWMGTRFFAKPNMLDHFHKILRFLLGGSYGPMSYMGRTHLGTH